MNRLLCLIVLASVYLTTRTTFAQPPSDAPPPAPSVIVERAWLTVRDSFYDPALSGIDWASERDHLLSLAAGATSGADTSALINASLAKLRASHTRHFHPAQREYYELLDIFNPDGIDTQRFPGFGTGLVHYIGVGVVTTTIDGNTFASEVYEAGPAAAAGLLVGDQLIGVEDGPWSDIAAFADREGIPTRLRIQRTSDPESRTTLTVTPARIHPTTLYKESLRASARIIDRAGKRMGYVRVRSYANPAYHDILTDLLSTSLKDIDGLVLDFRGGWGGASPDYLNLFNPMLPTLDTRPREDTPNADHATDWESRRFSFRKPLVLLVDSETRSGKEIMAYSLKKHQRATLVGERTAGAVLAGSPFPLPDASLLYLAVRDVRVDGERLEGVGVEVDISASRTVPFAIGTDAPFDRAVEALFTILSAPSKP